MDKIEKIRQEIGRLYDGEAPKHDQQCDFSDGYFTGIGAISKFLDTLSEESNKSLEEAAEEYEYEKGHLYHPSIKEIFIAGAEWQKEQDQPITGNSLEQEWLRYVDKKKKEHWGELPSLGEYGWLQIARHFAEWQKAQMLKEAKSEYIPELGYKVKIVIIPEKEENK